MRAGRHIVPLRVGRRLFVANARALPTDAHRMVNSLRVPSLLVRTNRGAIPGVKDVLRNVPPEYLQPARRRLGVKATFACSAWLKAEWAALHRPTDVLFVRTMTWS